LGAIRWLIGRIILGLEALGRPRPVQRSAQEQARVEAEARSLVLYQFLACPFCVKVRRTLHRLAVPVETRAANRNPAYREELVGGGGKYQVPCLRIAHQDGSVEWLYESSAINAYLERRFAG
jgi:glutaredoxin